MISLSTWRSICAPVYILSRRAYFAFSSLNSLSWLASRPLYLTFPLVERGLAHSMLPAQVRHFLARLVLVQQCNDLRFGESALLHPDQGY